MIRLSLEASTWDDVIAQLANIIKEKTCQCHGPSTEKPMPGQMTNYELPVRSEPSSVQESPPDETPKAEEPVITLDHIKDLAKTLVAHGKSAEVNAVVKDYAPKLVQVEPQHFKELALKLAAIQ